MRIPEVLARMRIPTLFLRIAASCPWVGDRLFFYAVAFSEFKPIQVRSEIMSMMGVLRRKGCRSLLEIGTASGGSSLLFGRALGAKARLTTVDLESHCDPDRLKASMRRGVDLRVLIADSHASETVGLVAPGGAGDFDGAFIDGDHSYEGVRLDTLRFGPLVRPGGILIFHDIQPAQPGRSRGLYVGGVPDWWKELVAAAPGRTHELIGDRDQSGFGIGWVQLPDDPSECRLLFEALGRTRA